MQCTLCAENMVFSQGMHPNLCTFECGHSFHLSCVLSYAKEKITNTCPVCNPVQHTFFADFGDDRIKSMQVLIEKRRKINMMEKPKSYFSLFSTKTDLKSMINSGTSLHTLKLNGYIPESFIEEGIRFKDLSNTYTVDSLIDFGFRFHHMLVMCFLPEDFKKFDLNQMDELNIKAADMLQTSISIRQLAELGIDLYKLCEMKWTFADIQKIGGDCQTIRLLTPKLSDIKTYFAPTKEEWESAGFTEEAMQKYKYDVDVSIIKKKKAVRKKLNLTGRNMLF